MVGIKVGQIDCLHLATDPVERQPSSTAPSASHPPPLRAPASLAVFTRKRVVQPKHARNHEDSDLLHHAFHRSCPFAERTPKCGLRAAEATRDNKRVIASIRQGFS